MLHRIEQVLDEQQLKQVLDLLKHAPPGHGWVHGTATSGKQSAPVKNNQQMPEQGVVTVKARDIVVQALMRHPLFMSAALPRRLYPPNFNRYCFSDGQNSFGDHIDNALRRVPEQMGGAGFIRTDLSCTLFLNEPDTYEGGELVIQGLGQNLGGSDSHNHGYKLEAGDLLLYPASTVHRVNPVTRGERIACFFWVESMVQSLEQRQTLHDLDMSLTALRSREMTSEAGESAEAIRLTGVYHNLLRMWAKP